MDMKATDSPASALARFLDVNTAFRRAALHALDRDTLTRLGSDVDALLRSQNAYMIKPVHFPLVVEPEAMADMGRAAIAIMALQRRLLVAMAAQRSRTELLDLFGIRRELERYVDWSRFGVDDELISRFDAVLDAEGRFRFCEINTDPAIGGCELFGFAAPVMDRLSERFPPDAQTFVPPYAAIADHVARRAAEAPCDRVVILNFERNIVEGYFDYSEFEQRLQQACGAIPVFRCSEFTYERAWLEPEAGNRTVVYRFFSDEDMTDGGTLFGEVIASGARVVNTLETYFYQSKQWFALLHDPIWQQQMSDAERDIVARYIPQTASVTPQTREALLAQKERWVFKADLGTCGKAVLIGRETAAAEIRQRLDDASAGNWTAQELLDSPRIEVSVDANWNVEPAYVVFGLYVVGARISGLSIRASTVSRVVNASSGASAGWCVPLQTGQ